MATPSVAVLGSGAVGTYFAGLLIERGHNVAIVSRASKSSQQREDKMREHGLTMGGPQQVRTRLIDADTMRRALAPPSALKTCDIIYVTVKRPGNVWVGEVLSKYAKRGATVVCCQNGIAQREELQPLAGSWTGQILDGMLLISVNYTDQPRPTCLFYPNPKLDMLEIDGAGERGAAAQAAAELIAGAGFPAKAVPDIATQQRTKVVFNMNNATSALLGLDVGQALSDPTSKRLLAACVGEAAAAFTAEGFTIDPKVSMYLKILRLPPHLFRCVRCLLPAPPPGFASSMNHDLVATDGRATEVGFLNGEVVEAGKRAGVPTPVTSAVLQVVTEMEQGKRPRRVLSSDEAVALFLGPTPYGSV